MTQNKTLLTILQRGESITTLEAMRLPAPICRLSERIRELEKDGYRFDKEPVRQNGRRYVRYALRQFELTA